jgi:hypothetical protein
MLGAAGAGAATFSRGRARGGPEAGTLTAASLVGVTTALLAIRRGPTRPPRSSRPPIVIVPWGVLVTPKRHPDLALGGGAFGLVDLVCEMDAATPFTRWSVVCIDTDRESFAGRARGGVSLERLERTSSATPEARDQSRSTWTARRRSMRRSSRSSSRCWPRRRLLHGGALSERIRCHRPATAIRAAPAYRTRRWPCCARGSSSLEEPTVRGLVCLIAAETRNAAGGARHWPGDLPASAGCGRRARGAPPGDGRQRVGSPDELTEFCPTPFNQLRAWSGDREELALRRLRPAAGGDRVAGGAIVDVEVSAAEPR